jgi:dephospho-CoA kinase
MYVIGVTGGVGTGKTTVAGMLADLGAAVIDADQLAHQVIQPGGPAYAGLIAAFGPSIVRADGNIDRRRLADLAFADAVSAGRLNDVVHPPVIDLIRVRLAALAEAGQEVAVIDVPLLYESGLDAMCDEVWVVRAQPAVRRRRLARRNGVAAAAMIEREAWQMPMPAKVARAHVVIDTSFGFARTQAQVERRWQALRDRLI